MGARVFDCFLFHNELDLLECRLEELSPVVERFVIVESGETHTGHPKGSSYLATKDRFRRWEDQIQHVWVPKLSNADPRKRENEQRERIRDGLVACGATPEDIVIHSDVDEIPTEESVRNVEESLRRAFDKATLVAFDQAPHYFAVDWKHPWRCAIAPAASRLCHIDSFWEMRKASQAAPLIPRAGWHFSWLGDRRAHLAKLDAIYEGPEIAADALPRIIGGDNWRLGLDVFGVQMAPVDIDNTFPKYIWERRCPATWFRPRDEERP